MQGFPGAQYKLLTGCTLWDICWLFTPPALLSVHFRSCMEKELGELPPRCHSKKIILLLCYFPGKHAVIISIEDCHVKFRNVKSKYTFSVVRYLKWMELQAKLLKNCIVSLDSKKKGKNINLTSTMKFLMKQRSDFEKRF